MYLRVTLCMFMVVVVLNSIVVNGSIRAFHKFTTGDSGGSRGGMYREDVPSVLKAIEFMEESLANKAELKVLRHSVKQSRNKVTPTSIPGYPPCRRTPPLQRIPTPWPEKLKSGLEELEEVFKGMFEKVNAYGGVASVVYDQQHLLTYTYGNTRDPSKGPSQPINSDTRFFIGSVSKVFTDLMAMHLRDAGKLSLLDQVTRYLPEYSPTVPNGGASKRGATLRDLGSHLAGLPRYAPCAWDNCTHLTLDEAVDIVSNWTLLWPSMTQLAYSNTGFSLLGGVLERIAGTSFEDYVGKLVSRLNMSRTLFHPPSNTTNMAYAYDNGVELPLTDLGFRLAAGGIISTANDMTEFMKFLFRTTESVDSTRSQILDGTTIREWLNTRLYTDPLPVRDNTVMFTEWGFPWQYFTVASDSDTLGNFTHFDLTTKDGSVPGYATQMVLQNDMKVGVFLTMTTKTDSQGSIYSDTVVNTAFSVVPLIQQVLSELPYHAPVPPKPEEFVGTYNGEGPLAGVSAKIVYGGGDRGEGFYASITQAGNTDVIALQYEGDDSFLELPAITQSCLEIEAGNHYMAKFSRSPNGAISGFRMQGDLPFPFVFSRV